MDELIAFLQARLDEDEQAARLADTPTRWKAEGGEFGPKVVTGVTDGGWSRECTPEVWRCDDPEDGCMSDAAVWMAEGRHIARHDPARVLADVAAKRAIIAAADLSERAKLLPGDNVFGYHAPGLSIAIRHLAAAYADHPDYREEWKP